MIAFLEGQVRAAGATSLVVQTGGVGYKVFPVGFSANVGETVALHIFDYIREDRRELFGFIDEEVRDLFEKLIDISGVGPRLAQKVLSVGSKEEITQSILLGDIEFLTRMPGIGTKTAQKIVLELQGILVLEDSSPADDDTFEALKSLGYSEKDIKSIITTLKEESVEGRIKEALRLLSRKYG